MPSRTLREGLVASDKVAAMVPASQDRFPRYFLLADDYGCFRVQAEVIKGDIYPRRPDITAEIVANDLVEFERVGCLKTWRTEDGHTYGFFIGWWEHNRNPRPTSRRKTARPPHPNADPPADSRSSKPRGDPEFKNRAEPELPLGSRSLPNGALRQTPAPAVAVRSSHSQFAHADAAEEPSAAEQPAAADPPATGPAPDKPKPPPEHQQLVDHGVRVIEAATQVAYKPGAEDGRHAKSLLGRFGLDAAREVFELAAWRYRRDVFWRDKGLTFRLVANDANALRTARHGARAPPLASMREEPASPERLEEITRKLGRSP